MNKEAGNYRIEKFFSLKDKIIYITGAAGQLGSSLVSAFVENDVCIVASDTDLAILQTVANKLKWPKEEVLLQECDIRSLDSIKAMMDQAETHFKAKPTILINNAGVSVFEPFLERPEESIDWVMDVNIKGTFFCIQEFIRRLQDEKLEDASIVNIASMYGIISPDPRIYTDCPRKNSEIYGATKAGIIQMSRYFAVHAAEYGIRVNAISLGGIRNAENPQGDDFQKNYGFRCPMKRMAETSEIVGAALYLASPAATYVNGHNLVVDGGMSAW